MPTVLQIASIGAHRTVGRLYQVHADAVYQTLTAMATASPIAWTTVPTVAHPGARRNAAAAVTPARIVIAMVYLIAKMHAHTAL